MRAIADLRLLLRGRDFRRLFAVRLASQFSDGVFQVALASYVLFSPERQASPEAIAASLAVVLLPFSVLGPFTGVLIDRWSRRQILAWANLVRAGVMLVLVALVGAGLAGPWFFLVVLLALSVNRFLLAALSAALPHVVDEERLVMANSVTPTSGTVLFLLGLGAGGLVREAAQAVAGAPGAPRPGAGNPGDLAVLLTAAVLFAVAAALALRIGRAQLGPDFDPALPSVREHARHVLVGLVDGLAHLRQRREAADGLLAIGAHRFFYGISTVSTILLYRSYFNPPDRPEEGFAGLAVAVAVSGAGFLTAALVTPLATSRLTLQQWVTALLVLAAVVEVLPGAFYTVPTLLVAAFALGLSAQGVKISVDTLVQEWVDDAFRGRVFAIYDVIFNVAFVAAAAVGAVILPLNGKSYPALALIACGYAVTAAVYWRIHQRQRTAVPGA